MAKDWIMIRVSRATHQALRRVRESLELAELNTQVMLERDDRERVSLDQVIQRLVAFRDAHAKRRALASARRRCRSREARKAAGGA